MDMSLTTTSLESEGWYWDFRLHAYVHDDYEHVFWLINNEFVRKG